MLHYGQPLQNYGKVCSVPTKNLVRQCVPKKSAVLVCITMAKLKMNRHVTNKNADLLKKNQLNGLNESVILMQGA